ncbi:uncharacterized protein TRAVEDRAFT_50279 [Trametes versicolor FP-101664 SS1]|uniref:uncharacterized protein n=1 Tax=Trametes versicolor (strain FP-101664) TaxID=717944 RepID=UPI0004623590|nr:uncharacterized protein TRAVEDRAFT_50279 [Trametes versicolor FP-101664 SS1]EIW55797.1 hypothetical protein TRAVEDRAFT_50279 [Trametes versicolor FP-101664 SS1]
MSSSLTPAVLRCLVIGEILQVVVDELDTSDYTGKIKQRTLASLAQTCKALYAAYIPGLWESQDNLEPLLQFLPPDIQTETLLPGAKTAFQLTQPEELDWTRFNHHAQFVRHLRWQTPWQPNRGDVSLLNRLAALCSQRPAGTPLLPQLRELEWRETRATSNFSLVDLLLTPTITQMGVTISSDVDPAIMKASFKRIGEVCKSIESLEIRTYSPLRDHMREFHMREFRVVVGNVLTPLLRGLPELQRYKSHDACLSADGVKALAAHPKLVEVDLCVQSQVVDVINAAADHRSPHGRWFDALETLVLNVHRMEGRTMDFLGAMQWGHLREVRLKSNIVPAADMVKQHLALLARAASPDSLRRVQLDFHSGPYHGNPNFGARRDRDVVLDIGEVLQPLYAFPHIDTIIIRCPALVTGAAALQDIAHAWPKLKTLSLIQPDPQFPPRLVLEDLAPLARSCPGLDLLELNVYANRVPCGAALLQLLPEPSRCRLQWLTALDATIENPVAVANFLAYLFPALDQVVYQKPKWDLAPYQPVKEYTRMWEKVERMLKDRLEVPELYAYTAVSERVPLPNTPSSAFRDHVVTAWRHCIAIKQIGFSRSPDVVHLAQNCARLDTLGLHLHADQLPDADALARLLPAPSQCGLRRLTAFAGVNIENPAKVAGVLARLFPVLREAEYGRIAWVLEGEKRPFEGSWAMVQRLLGWRLGVTNGFEEDASFMSLSVSCRGRR